MTGSEFKITKPVSQVGMIPEIHSKVGQQGHVGSQARRMTTSSGNHYLLFPIEAFSCEIWSEYF
jgi:hypothetical protein